MPFENVQVPVLKNYHEILTNMYGNYMELPEEEERGIWHNNQIIFAPDIPYKEYFRKMNDEKNNI